MQRDLYLQWNIQFYIITILTYDVFIILQFLRKEYKIFINTTVFNILCFIKNYLIYGTYMFH